jgi:transposase
MNFAKNIHIEETITISLTEYNSLLSLKEEVEALKNEIKLLKEEIRLLKNGRNSKTSSSPPSQDISRSKEKSLREPSSRKSGGQPGHTGSTLEMKEPADEVIEHKPGYCKQCGEELSGEEYILTSRKQEIVLPPIMPQYVEHQSYRCTCKKCGFTTESTLPEHLKANVQYGSQISAWVTYLSVRQYLSYERIAELMRDCFNIPISQGTIDNMLKNLSEKAQYIYHKIQNRIEQSPVVGGDETGIKINGKKGWLFTFQTPLLTFLSISLSRGFDNIINLFKNGFPMSVYVSDCLPAQLKTPAKLHQICLAHLIRELNNFIDVFRCQWAMEMKLLLQSAIELKSELNPPDYSSANEKVVDLSNKLNELLHKDLSNEHKKIQAFIKRLNKNNNAILTFLYHPKVPPHNNASEKAIRNAKVKMKVSNQFMSLEGAKCFAVLRSVIDTTIKNSQNVLSALVNLANFVSAE